MLFPGGFGLYQALKLLSISLPGFGFVQNCKGKLVAQGKRRFAFS
jgi:hypothetical protein